MLLLLGHAGLAQLAEHFSCKEDVVGSIPASGSMITTDEMWTEAERIREDLQERGILCGHPYDGDVESTIIKLMQGGYLKESSNDPHRSEGR